MQVRSLALLSGLRIWHCRELWCGSQTRLRSPLLWLWRRPAATAPIRPLAWELPCVVGLAVKRKNIKLDSFKCCYLIEASPQLKWYVFLILFWFFSCSKSYLLLFSYFCTDSPPFLFRVNKTALSCLFSHLYNLWRCDTDCCYNWTGFFLDFYFVYYS